MKPADVLRVAKAYLNEDQSTTGWFIPQEEAAAPAQKSASRVDHTAQKSSARGPHYYRNPDSEKLQTPYSNPQTPPAPLSRLQTQNPNPATAGAASGGGGAGGGTKIAPHVRRRAISGVDVVTLKTGMKDVVTIRGVLNAGDVFNSPENSAIADLTAGMLDKGTAQHDKFALAEMLEQVGATISFSTGSHTLNFTAKTLRKDLALVLGLLAEQLRTPKFDAEEFAKLKKQVAGRYKRELEDTDFRAGNAFSRAIFPAGHPNRPPEDEKYLADIESATLDQLKAFHAAQYGTTGARIIAVGDVDEAAIERAINESFAGWKGGRAFPAVARTPAVTAGRTEKVNMPGKTSISIVVGQPSGLRYNDPAYQTLNFGTAVLGSGFFSARLLDIIRNQEGLTYGIVANLANDTYTDGAWSIQGTFAPELLEKGMASTLRELRRFHTAGLTADELKIFKTTLTGSYKVTLSTTSGLASALLNALQRGYGPEWLDEYPSRIQALGLEEVNAAIKKFLDPQRMVLVQAGTFPAAEKK